MRTFFENEFFKVDESLVFPDGQPHVKLLETPKTITNPTISCRIRNSQDLVKLALVKDVYNQKNLPVDLKITYLMGGRMDRSINPYYEPFTLNAITNLINSMKFNSVSIFCPHSRVSLDLINNSSALTFHESMFYDVAIFTSLKTIPKYKELTEGNDGNANLRMLDTFSIVYPDKGASDRMLDIPFSLWYKDAKKVILEKKRDLATGKILGMQIVSGEVKKECIILDDLCDGGATFKGAAQCLREKGAEKVFLAVCHGVFSKGLPIEGIDYVCTTNSFADRENTKDLFVYNLF